MKNSSFKKALSLLLAALMLLAAMPVVSFAADDDLPETPAAPVNTEATPSDASAEVYEAADYDDAVRYVRDRLLARETVIRVACPDPSFEATCQESIFAYDSKSPFTGDYLKNSLERTLDIYPMTDGSYQFVVSYQDGCRPEEEAAVNAAVAAILAELSLDENSPYEKALAIYTWLCEHVRPLAPSEAQEVHHSAYAALVPDADGRRAAVCQGFSAAFYALALSAGLEARMILGSHADGNEQMTAHAWNIVQLDGSWYYLDAFAGAWYGKDAVSPGREDGMNAYFCKPLKDGYGGYTITYADAYTASEIADYPYDERKDSSYNIVTGSCGTDVTYTLNLVDRSLVISGEGDMRDYSVGDIPAIDPDELENASGFPAVPKGWVLPPWFFYECPVESLVVSEGVTGVGDYAFLLMLSLKEVTLPASLETVGVAAFLFDPGLERLVVPENVTRIGTLAFCGCVSLRSLTICNNACVVDSQDNVSGENIEEEKLTIPSAVELYCPSQTAGVIEYAEQYHLTYHYDSDGNNRCDICQKWLSECGDTLFWQFDEATGALTIIGSGPMYNFADHTAPWYPLRDKIQSVIFEDESETERITSIGDYAFSGCSALNQFTISDGITSLGKFVWKDTPLTELTIPATVKSFAKEGCLQGSNVRSVVFEKTTGDITRNEISNFACVNADQLTHIKVPDVLWIGVGAFMNCSRLTEIELPEKGLRRISRRAFKGCYSLKTISLPEGLERIYGGSVGHSDEDGETFADCTSLETIVLPEGLDFIPWGAFSGCTSLSTVTLPASVIRIGRNAFYRCSSLKTIDFKEGLRLIGKDAFAFCSSLTSIALPEGMKSITGGAFRCCTALAAVSLPSSLKYIGWKGIDNNLYWEHFTGTAIGYTFYGCRSLKEVFLPAKLNQIGEYSFEGCEAIETITFPESLQSIGAHAFTHCSALQSVYFCGSPHCIYQEAFESAGKFIFHCHSGSSAESYALERGITAHTELAKTEEIIIPATCTAEGSCYELTICNNCARELERSVKTLPKIDHVDNNHDNVCDACGEEGFCRHDYQPSRIEPTCTEKGAEIMTCSNCGYSYSASEIPANGHDFSIAVDEIPATCTKSGVTAGLKCAVCGAVTGRAVVPAAGHQMEVTSPRKPASCTEPGQTVILTCSVCGYTEGGEEIPALGHLDNDDDGYCDECGKELEEGDPFRRIIIRIFEFFFGTNGGNADAGGLGVVIRLYNLLTSMIYRFFGRK